MTEERFSIFVNFDNDLEKIDEILNSQLHLIEINKIELDEECTVEKPHHILILIILVML